MSNQSEFLWKKEAHLLSTVKVAIRRHNITSCGPSLPIERRLNDPTELNIHYRPDEGIRPIFARDDIIVNPAEEVEARAVYPRTRLSPQSDKRDSRSRSHSQSRSRSYRTWKSRSRSYSPSRSHYSHRSDRGKSKFEERDHRGREKRSRSPLRPGEYRPAEWQRQQRKRSRTPLRPGEYRPTSRERELQRSRRRSRSPVRQKSKERERKRSKSPLKPGEYRPDRPSTSSYHRRPRSRSSSLDRRHGLKSMSPSRKIYERNSGSPKKSYESSRRKSPTYRKSRSPSSYHRKSERSRSRERRRSRSKNKSPPPKNQQHAPPYMEHSGIMQGYPYYEGPEGGYWIPPGVRPGFMPPMYAPYPPPGAMRPMFYPPRMMIGPYPGPRPRLPIYNSRQVKKYTPTNAKSGSTEESSGVTINEIMENAENEKGESSGSGQSKRKEENNDGNEKEKEDEK